MAAVPTNQVLERLRQVVMLPDGAGLTDGQLLGCFIEQHDEAAFASIVRRHGPMVLGVCRRVLRNHHDAEDAFQATFLILARKARSIVPRAQVANWLYGVAYRTALKANAMVTRRRIREQQVMEMPEPEARPRETWHDLQTVLDRELSRLPDKYRVPVILCDLEGKTRKEAARQLGWPEGSVAGRLARARALLAKRLVQRGIVLSGGSLAALLSHQAVSAGVPTSVESAAVKAGCLQAAGQAATAEIPVRVVTLAEGVIRTMWLAKLTVLAPVMLGLVILGCVMLAAGSMVAPGIGAATPAGNVAPDAWVGGDTPPDKGGPQGTADRDPRQAPAQGEAKVDQNAKQPGGVRVTTGKKKATIEGQLKAGSKLVLRIGTEQDKLAWTDEFKAVGTVKAVLELSDRIKLEDGSFGQGFVYTVEASQARTQTNIHLPKTGPLPSGQLRFREEGKIIQRDGVTTFADITTADGKSVPVSIVISNKK